MHQEKKRRSRKWPKEDVSHFTSVQRHRVETSVKLEDCVDDFEGADALASEK